MIEKNERLGLMKWLKNNDPIPLFFRVVKGFHVGDEPLVLAHILAAHSIGLADSVDPIHLYTIGRSGKGKGNVSNSVLKLFSEDVKIPLASFSPKVLFYASQENGLDGKIIHTPEISINRGDEEKLALLRILTDSPSSNLRAEHMTLSEKREVVRLKLDGRQSFWFNSETPLEDAQLKNRMILGNPNESKQTDDLVFQMQKKRFGWLQKNVSENDLSLCRSLNDVLLFERGFDVFIPFIDLIEFPGKSNRRLFPIFLTFLKSVVKLYMFQRIQAEVIGGGSRRSVLIAEPFDFEVAAWVWQSLYPVTASQVSRAALDLLEYIPIGEENAMDKSQLSKNLNLGESWIYKKNRELYQAGLISSSKIERRYVYWRNSASSLTDLGVRVNWSNFDSMSLNEPFKVISASIPGRGAFKDYIQRVRHSQKSNQNWLEVLKLGENPKIQDFNSDSEMKKSKSELEELGGSPNA